MADPVPTNNGQIRRDLLDKFGTPRATFDLTFGDDDRRRDHRMMADIRDFASAALGVFCPAANRGFLPRAARSTCRETRMNETEGGTSVVDSLSKVWGFQDLYLGGNGLSPRRNPSNPTLASWRWPCARPMPSRRRCLAQALPACRQQSNPIASRPLTVSGSSTSWRLSDDPSLRTAHVQPPLKTVLSRPGSLMVIF